MPKNLNPYSRPQGGFVTTWTEVATGGAGADPECTRAAETGKSHFITFIVCNTDNTDPGHTVKGYLRSVEKTSGPLFLEVWPIEQDGTPSIINFSSPIQMPEGTVVSLEGITSDGSDSCSLTMGGFTSDTRVD